MFLLYLTIFIDDIRFNKNIIWGVQRKIIVLPQQTIPIIILTLSIVHARLSKDQKQLSLSMPIGHIKNHYLIGTNRLQHGGTHLKNIVFQRKKDSRPFKVLL